MSTQQVAVTNATAKSVLASLKSGAVFKGTVCAQSAGASMDVVLISIDLPAIGERQVAVKTAQKFQSGQDVVLQCVPDSLKPERYVFRILPEQSLGAPIFYCIDLTSGPSWQSIS